MMLTNYLKITIRTLLRQKLFSFINIFGLALSMSVCLLVLMRIKEQVGYDKFHPGSDRIYRITTKVTNKEGNTFKLASTPLPLAATLASDYNFLQDEVRLYPSGGQTTNGGGKKLTLYSAFTDESFFKIFGFKLESGHAGDALTAPNSIVLSKETAARFFGSKAALGQILSIGQLGDFRVSGIMEKPPGKSHIDFEAYISMSSVPLLEKTGKLANNLASWNNGTIGYTYIKLKKTAQQKQLTAAVQSISAALMKETKITGKENSNLRFSLSIRSFSAKKCTIRSAMWGP